MGRDVVRDILQVSYKDSVDDIDSFEIQINNWDAEALDFKYADDPLFDPGKTLELYLGYHGEGDPRLMIKGEITSLRPSFPADGTPKLAISGLNVLHRFRTKQESHTYIKKKDSDIAVEVGSRLGITVKVNDEARADQRVNEYLIQNNQFDVIFLMERARRDGYDLIVREMAGEEPTLYFGPSLGVRRLTYLLVYGQSLVEFQPTLTTANQVNEVTVRGWDAVNKKLLEETADRSMIKSRGVGSRGGQDSIDKSFSQRKEVMADKPFESPDEAKRVALDTLENISEGYGEGHRLVRRSPRPPRRHGRRNRRPRHAVQRPLLRHRDDPYLRRWRLYHSVRMPARRRATQPPDRLADRRMAIV